MSSHSEQSSSVIRFFDALFQEQNIKWLLGLGTLILLSSSTMLVTSHWDSYTSLWKYVVLMGYTTVFHVAGQIGYHRLVLRKTGTGLMALTVLLIPLSFAAFRWIHPASVLSIDGLFAQSGLLILLLINSVFAYFAASRIFRHFLLKTQPTFLASYLILAGFAAIVPSLPPVLATLVSLVAWGVFAVGSIKVNRHAFWLAEEYRKPRIFGFFPIILLGTQFLTLFATCLAPHVSMSWIGLGVVMTALPILLAADSLARVIQVRSQLESPPFPASVVLSMIAGIVMVISGVCISSSGFPQTSAFVPTALIAAVVMGLLARRTEKKGFVWLMMIFAVAVYQTCPVFFKELLTRLADQGASAIGEDKLPLAFYGLTYLPLLGGTSVLGQWLSAKNRDLFAVPMKQFSIILTLALVPIAFGHEKALFPVSLALGGLLTIQTFLFRDRRLQFASLGVFIIAAMGFVPFLRSFFGVVPTGNTLLLTWIATGAILQFPGLLLDRAAKRLPELSPFWNIKNSFQTASLFIIVCCTLVWTVLAIGGSSGTLAGVVCLALLAWHAFNFKNTFVSSITLAVPVIVALTFTANVGWSLANQILIATTMMAGLSLLGLLLSRKPKWLITQVFGRASEIVSGIGIIGLQIVFVPALLNATAGLTDFTMWGAAGVSIVAGGELAWRSKSRSLTILSWLSLLAMSGCIFMEVVQSAVYLSWVPVVWSALSLLIILVKRTLISAESQSDETNHRSSQTLDWCLGVTLSGIAIVGLPFFSGGIRLAGLIAIVGLYFMNRRQQSNRLSEGLLVLVNCHLLVLVVQLFSPNAEFLFALERSHLAVTSLPLALTAVLSSIFWRRRNKFNSELSRIAPVGLEIMAGLCLFQSLFYLNGSISLSQIIFAAITFATLIGNQCLLAFRKAAIVNEEKLDDEEKQKAEAHVWAAQIIALAGMIYFVLFGVIALSSTLALFAPMLLALLTWTISRVNPAKGTWNVFARPFRKTSFMLPALTVLVGVSQFLFSPAIYWPGMNSLALLLAGGFYFWRGLEEKRTGLLLGSAVTLNISLAMLWNDLNWSDPQLFLVPVGITVLAIVELLRSQIPTRLQNPLRYAGALSILVSPTFEIVGGSWIHLITLMLTSIVVVIVAMGLRVKALMYTGSAFLLADLIAIVVRGSIDQPSLLWLAGIAVGAAVIGLAAYCERHREKMLQQLRYLTSELETWS